MSHSHSPAGGGPSADVSVRVAWADDASAIAAVQVRAWPELYAGLLPVEVLPFARSFVVAALGAGRLRDRERGRSPHQKTERHLTHGRTMVRRDFRQHAAARCEQLAQPGQDRPLGVLAEVDHHVADGDDQVRPEQATHGLGDSDPCVSATALWSASS